MKHGLGTDFHSEAHSICTQLENLIIDYCLRGLFPPVTKTLLANTVEQKQIANPMAVVQK